MKKEMREGNGYSAEGEGSLNADPLGRRIPDRQGGTENNQGNSHLIDGGGVVLEGPRKD